ncbi:MAG: alpha/beta hydrolase [Armatimonadetes bacterium]|nr:alpha/beta hydrolase [Armatimonadota bacterium]
MNLPDAVGHLGTALPLLCATLVLACCACAEPAPVRPLWPGAAPDARGATDADRPEITVHLAPRATATGAAVIVCPGGGYRALMMSYEGHDIAACLNAHGVTGIVLKYRIQPYPAPVSIADGRRAVRLVRSRAKEWGLDPKRIGMMGFSAGGHLACNVGTSFDKGDPKAVDPAERLSCRPDFLVLVYPATDYAGMPRTEGNVTAQTPPAFLTHSVQDQTVPVEQSRRFYAALQRHKVPAEYLELPTGAHGLGCGKGPEWIAWQEACIRWLAGRKVANASK